MIELTPGQELALDLPGGRPRTALRVGLGWDHERTAGFIGSGAPHVDLDASVVELAGGQLFDLAFYNNLETRDGAVVHLGDNLTGHGEGDDEEITLDLGRVYPKVDTIVLLVSSYQGHTLEWINRAYCRLVGDDDVELARFTLTAGVPETGLVMARLTRRDEQHWTLRAIGAGVAVTLPTESLAALGPYV